MSDIRPAARAFAVLGLLLVSAETASAQTQAWDGLYVGAHAGGAWGGLGQFAGHNLDGNGAVAGVHGGFNQVFAGFLLGLEGDASWADVNDGIALSGTETTVIPNPRIPIVVTARTNAAASIDLDWLASLRVRAGVPVGNALFYATGGVAFAGLDVDATVETSGLPAVSLTDERVETGFAAGGGVELRLAENLSGRIEVLHFGFDGTHYAVGGAPLDVDPDLTVARAGLTLDLN